MRVENRPAGAIHKQDVDELHDLVLRAGAGDPAAFRVLFDRYHERVHRYAYLRLHDADEASDVMQDVFLAAWRGLPGFSWKHEGSFPAWLFAIARNVVGTHLRRNGRTVPVPPEALPQGEVEFESGAVSRQLLAAELARLTESQREVLVLRFLVGLPARDVAAVLGRSEGAVNALQVRGLERLREQMGAGR